MALAPAGSLLAALSGCSGEPAKTPVETAQADVSAAQKSLTDAETQAAASAAAFCSVRASYITALDRYGEVQNRSAATVGDVTDAGHDLVEPREETLAAGEDAVSLQEEVGQAEQALADAQAALAAAQASAAGQAPTPSLPSEASSAASSPPPATIARVQQAETEFADAMQQATATTAALQQTLTLAGYRDGPVDGQWTDALTDALEALQSDLGFPATGTVDAATIAAFEQAIASGRQTPSPSPSSDTPSEPSAQPSPTSPSPGGP